PAGRRGCARGGGRVRGPPPAGRSGARARGLEGAAGGDKLGPVIAAHADVVGSLLRPPELRAAQAAFADGKLDAGGLRAAEDRAVDAAIALHEAAGLPVVPA